VPFVAPSRRQLASPTSRNGRGCQPVGTGGECVGGGMGHLVGVEVRWGRACANTQAHGGLGWSGVPAGGCLGWEGL
jgi:hypothetical protein